MFRVIVLSSLFASLLLTATLKANTGDPIAIQRWPGEELTIETFSGLRLLIQSETGERLTDQNADITLLPGETCDHHLYRKANEEHPIWQRTSSKQGVPPNAVTVRSVRLCPVDQTTVLFIEVDGISILIVPPRWVDGESAYSSEEVVSADLLILPSTDPENLSSPSIQSLVAALKPQSILLSGLDIDDDSFAEVAEAIFPNAKQRTIEHNALAIRHQEDYQKQKSSIVRLSSKAWEMPEEIDERFQAMETACDYSQRVLTQLSTNRMNFKPSNGTHTPRWNAEHMMGRQLKFFSKIYYSIDPMIPIMDLNPAQMPDDYVPAHPTWDGAEEARQIKRVSQFCRRFAYLLDGMSLDDKPPAVRWPTLGALLEKMESHYQEHTANVVKKFELPDWPAEQPSVHATAPPITKPVLVP
ncbi:hypothetical protein LF1_13400 [Rubripirellula obstinata]|uniref:DinB superfamily protein n=1 Tax=Rubripirellula obstinata TaxID=406547 RepID=A0A5B1CE05_9BACT|nr:DinB family protein [Rubripirellula obstinata]KAA1258816.1 hypothetical protein LF1_13400 [Rubripirellula obstinata]